MKRSKLILLTFWILFFLGFLLGTIFGHWDQKYAYNAGVRLAKATEGYF